MSSSIVLHWSEAEKISVLNVFKKTTKDVEQGVTSIKEWMSKQPHLPEIAEDKVIENFLIMSKFRVEGAKEKLDAYYTVHSLIPEFFDKNPNGPEIHKMMEVVHYIPLPKLTKELQRIVILKAKDTNPNNFDVITYIAHTLNITEIRLREDMHLKEIQIYDLSGIKLGHLTKFTPSIIKNGAFILEKVFKSISQSLHFINAPSSIDTFISLLKTYLKPKMMNKIFVHRDMESLYKTVPKNVLPKDYGGEERSLQELSEEWKKTFLKYDELFKRLSKLKVNEKLRHDEFVTSDLLGINGNFRQLDID